jgi:hypothetical protein
MHFANAIGLPAAEPKAEVEVEPEGEDEAEADCPLGLELPHAAISRLAASSAGMVIERDMPV